MQKELMEKLADLVVEDINVSEDNDRIKITYTYVSKFRSKELDPIIDKMIEIINETGQYNTPSDDYSLTGRDNHIDYSRFVWIRKKEN